MENSDSNINDFGWNPYINNPLNGNNQHYAYNPQYYYRPEACYPYVANTRHIPHHYTSFYPPQVYTSGDMFVKETKHASDMANINGVLTQMGTDIGKMKQILELSRNDILIANNFIDKTTTEYKNLGKKYHDMECIMSEHIDKTETLVSKMNKLQKKIDMMDKKHNKKDLHATVKPVSTPDITKHNKDKKMVDTQDNLLDTSESETTIKQKRSKVNSTSIPSRGQSKEGVVEKPILPLLSFFSFLSNMDKQTKDKKENNTIDIEDNYDINDPVYADDMEVELKIENIDDLIKLGEEFKKERDEKELKRSKEKKISTKKNTNATKPDIIKLIIKDMEEQITPRPNVDPSLLSTRVQTTKSDDNKSDKSDDKYTKSGKKYNIDTEHVINLIVPLKRLQRMVGIQNVKSQLFNMILYFLQNFEDNRDNMLHTTIEGPPGIGKSKLCDIIAGVYAAMGIVKTDKVVRVRRPDLIAEYVGQTAHRTQRAIDDAEDGILIIDEAYGLGESENKDSFAKECIDTINQNLTEKKKNLIVIIAGYTDQLDRCFFSYNEGLKRRFPFRFTINKYTPSELRDIFYDKIRCIKWRLDKKLSSEYLVEFFDKNNSEFPHFGGDIETLLLNCKFAHSKRVLGKDPRHKKILTIEDFEKAFKEFKSGRRKEDTTYKSMFI
jgi:hypothetical protein